MIVVIAISIIIYEYMDKVGIFWPATALERSLLMLLLIRIYERSGVVTDRHILAIRGMHNVLSIWQVLYLVSIAHKKAVDANFKQIMSLGRPLDLGDETTTQFDRSTGGIIFVVLYLLLLSHVVVFLRQ